MNRNPLSKRGLAERLRHEILSRAHLGLSADELIDIPEIWHILIVLHPRRAIMERAVRNYYREIIRDIIHAQIGDSGAREFISVEVDPASAPPPSRSGPVSAPPSAARERPSEPAMESPAAAGTDIPPGTSLPPDAGLPLPLPGVVTGPPDPTPPPGAETKQGYVRAKDMSIAQRIASLFSDRRRLIGLIGKLPTLSAARRALLIEFVNMLFDEEAVDVRGTEATG